MIPGRTYTPGELARKLWRRKWVILGTTAAFATAAVFVSSRLPDRFRAETLILAAAQSVSKDYVRNTVTESTIKDRLPSISQQILSRSRLERIIEDLDLYAEIRKTRPLELVVDQMRTQIDIKPTEGSDSFRVSYEAQSPLTATQVTERLAGLFIQENSHDRTLLARETSAFLESQLENARQRLVEQEKRLEAYRLRYGPELPTQLQSNLQVIQNTQAQIQSLGEAINRDRDRRQLVARQLADVQSEQYLAEPTAPAGGVAPTSTAALLEAATADLRALELRLTAEHPDLVRAKQLVTDLESRAQSEAAAPPAGARPKPLTPSEIVKRNRAKELQAEMESLDRQVAAKLATEAELRTALDGYQARVEAVPTRESELIAITRDYDTLQTLYRSLLAKKEDSKIAENLEQRQVIEQFKVLDPPHLPERPFSPNRLLIDLGGAGLGLILGIALAALLELADKSVTSEADLRAVIEVPMLVMIPAIMSRAEQRRAVWRKVELSFALVVYFAACATAAWFTFRI
jgi:polysaccharide chain length determinant protein (PEP-CTERM system associated)